MADSKETDTTMAVPSAPSDSGADNADYKLELVLDRSHMEGKIGPMHYLAMFLWLGWFAFFTYFPVLFVFLMMLSPLLVGVVVVVVVTSAFYPISERSQPKVRHTYWLDLWLTALILTIEFVLVVV